MDNQNLFNMEGLADLGLRGGVDMRPTLLRILTDLYVQKLTHTPDEERHYTELALRLLQSVDVPTRVAVAKRLARHLSPPRQVLQALAGDLPDVAAPVRSHPMLQSPAPVDQARPQQRASQPAVEERVAEVSAARAQARSVEAPHDFDAAKADELNELFFAASASERRLILLNLEIVAPLPSERLRVSRDRLIGTRLEAAVLGRRHEEFAQDVARSLQIPREQARRILRDELGEPLVVAGKALGIRRDVLYRILMFANPAIGHSVERVHALAALYDEITPQAAEGLVVIWQALPESERAGEAYWPAGERRLQTRTAEAAEQRAPAVRQTYERRSAS